MCVFIAVFVTSVLPYENKNFVIIRIEIATI